MIKKYKMGRSLFFVLFCVRNLCGVDVRKGFIYCASAIFSAKIVLVVLPILFGRIIDVLNKPIVNQSYLVGLVVVFCFIGLLSTILLAVKNYFVLIIRERISRDLSIALLRKLQQFSHAFFHDNNVSKISQINNMGLDALHAFMVAFLSDIIPFLFELLLIASIVVVKFNGIVSLLILGVFSLYAYTSVFFSQKEKDSNFKISHSKINLSSQFYEDVVNFDSVKITNTEKLRLNYFSNKANEFLSLAKAHGALFFNKALIQNIILYSGLLMILSVSLVSFLHKKISVGDFVILYTYFFQITAPLVGVLRSYEIFSKSLVDIDPLMQLLERKPDLKVIEPKIKITSAEIDIEIKNVNFSYDVKKVLSNVYFSIPNRQRISLVGDNGSGKSTIAKLLMRFYDPETGAITINGNNIKNISFSELRNLIAYVPQEISLLNDTILNNIVMGRENIGLCDVLTLTKGSGILDFVQDLKANFDTIVGDRGLKLSGGQKQRIAIARALIRQPRLLILDEYNASIDLATEHHLSACLNPHVLNCSILLITHRLKSAVDSDKVIVIKNGAISQQGQHDILINTPGWYQSAWQSFVNLSSHIASGI